VKGCKGWQTRGGMALWALVKKRTGALWGSSEGEQKRKAHKTSSRGHWERRRVYLVHATGQEGGVTASMERKKKKPPCPGKKGVGPRGGIT